MTAPLSHDRLLATLSERLGLRHVRTDPADLAPHLVESRGLYRGHALAVVAPGTTEEVAFTVRTCAEARVPVVAQGGNTGLVGGGVPFGGIVLSLNRLDRLRAIDPLGASMTVEAGMILADVQAAAEAAGMLFPLSWAAEGTARIGGGLATNAGGLAVLAYGNARDLVLGLEVVLADGRIWNGLKALRKNNAGYDLKHLFVGSEGTLGIITAATLKLYPKPLSTCVGFVGLASARAALALFARLRAGADRGLTAFEYMPRFGLEMVLRHGIDVRPPLSGSHAAYALVELSSPRPGSDSRAEMEALLAEAMEAGEVEDAVIGGSAAQDVALWRLRELLPEVQKAEGGSIKHDVSLPLSRLADFLDEASAACEAAMPGLRPCPFGHFGDGNIHFNLTQPVGMEKAEFLSQWGRFNAIVHGIVERMDGSIAAEHGIGLIKRDELARTADPVGLDLMRRLKAALDPHDGLNPGKVVALSDDPPPALPV
ncbi:UNVERIFIED_ORG: FAD/FMN-containing dehydrogenase [Methylobacterium sp. SuP10 SLI 274]|uniref:FAD-binding oxidoreductase n=1 Tax=Methylorubrum extorquens TaxID=408 RepID=UPI00209EDCAA|nr:FAD-binding oxidoreductase [Methylorubrum extorquens]MDF9864252.1 FAD/FMN-containing dehydrogenase [Methylorubrum pseudosasae]MDH6637842.1 FAD/FMN-containing dehydrogenase [Methylobacterium sp. SuP10 SLI 274]MDH6667022.1 FAD/FMN-containing dehydrogenase [Methylorubrum zatmanii]MCP1558927.1 FAD/FMN-containing dehydrogenase [Methylorubrum extorquens]MDF9792560.1 FAD/FMN-containing dehydrogenase [Methylorubrum extorquens]